MRYIYQSRVKGRVWFATMLWKILYLLTGKYSLNWRKWDYRYLSHVVGSTALWQTNTSWVPQSGMEQSGKGFRLNPFSSGSWMSSCSFTRAANIRMCYHMPEILVVQSKLRKRPGWQCMCEGVQVLRLSTLFTVYSVIAKILCSPVVFWSPFPLSAARGLPAGSAGQWGWI